MLVSEELESLFKKTPNISNDAKDIFKLLDKEGKIIEIKDRGNGKIYVCYKGELDSDFSSITACLFKYAYVVSGFNMKENDGHTRVWLNPIKELDCDEEDI